MAQTSKTTCKPIKPKLMPQYEIDLDHVEDQYKRKAEQCTAEAERRRASSAN